ncbi:MAG: Ig-like domain-containing protein [Candidatus Thalassarchaeaceae archaeon]|nr:Ig-like domain-containing protein [Candidatus Thalassarchaeaceae archaeon]
MAVIALAPVAWLQLGVKPMEETHRKKSLFLSALMLTSVMVGLIGMMPMATAANDTSTGTISGTEVWSGSHTLTGDVIIAAGAKLIVQPGTTVTIPNGTIIDVRGALCAADVACGANGMGSAANQVTFTWQDPVDSQAYGSCYGIYDNNHWNRDPSCNEGILFRNTVDIGYTKLNNVKITNAYGIPRWVTDISEVKYGAIVLDGASPVMTDMEFEGVNTSSLLVLDLASPTILGGEFVTGDDDTSLVGSAIQAYGAGSALNPFTILSATFTGTDKGCGQNDDGRHVLWAEKSFVDVSGVSISSGDFGMRFDDTAGTVSNATITTTCNGIDVNNKRKVGVTDYKLVVEGNTVTTEERSPLTAFNRAWVDFNNNDITGASDGSGIQISDSIVTINGGSITDIGGWNGIWSIGESDVIVEGVTITGIAKEPIVAGEYHYGDSGWSVPYPTKNRMYIHDSIIEGEGGSCSSVKAWGGDFPCPAVHAFRTSLTLIDNDITAGGDGDGIRAIGSIMDVRDNDINASGTGAIIINHDTNYAGQAEYGSLAFFSMNRWQNVGQTYNITKSSVTVQSENIPIPSAASNTTNPVKLAWPDAEANGWSNWVGQVLLPTCSVWPPQEFPLTMSLNNNSTVFTFANLTNVDTSNIYIDTSPIKWAVQIRKAEIVKFRAVVSGVRVSDATVLIEDARGNDLYSLTTDAQGWTPEVSMASDFHLDMTGGGPGGINPDRHADDPGENSCSDGMDNDGDLLWDEDDPDCQGGSSTREMSLYYVSAYKFGKGYKRYSMTMTSQTGVLSEIISLENMGPSLTVLQGDGHSFKRAVNFTGSAHDGVWAGIYGHDGMSLQERNQLAQWDQQGVVEQIQVKDPFTSDWIDMRLAVDHSGSGGEVSYNNHPFRNWYFEFDMSDQPEGDYTFEFRSYDGIEYSSIITRTIKLNTEPPTVWVDGPADETLIDDGYVHFTGRASDSYNGIFGSDIQRIWFEVNGPDGYYNLFHKPGGMTWSADWSVGHLPSGAYDVSVWANDSAFCSFAVDECTPVELTLNIDNENAWPVIQLITPFDGQTIEAAEDTLIQGVARDTDGTVTKVEITILDPQAGFLELPSGSHSIVTDIQANGAWQVEWDTQFLVHNYHYIVQARSFDGFQYSEAAEAEIIIDNPPNQDNNIPTFESDTWPNSIRVFCEEQSQSDERCGDGVDFDLSQYFSDADDDSMLYYVLDDENKFEDDLYYDVITINANGVANYNPLSMSYHSPNLEDWSLEGVVFVAQDPYGSRAYSLPMDFDVVGVVFSSSCVGVVEDVPDTDPQVTQVVPPCRDISRSETLQFAGMGQPGKTVVAETAGGLRISSTIVDSDGLWELDVPGNRLEKGDNTIQFVYGGVDQPTTPDSFINVGGGSDSGSGLLMTIVWIVLGIVAVAILGGVFVFFFVEFEEYDEDDLDEDEVEVDPYAWAKQGQAAAEVGAAAGTAAAAAPVAQPAAAQPAAVQGYPGWKWDAEQNKWVPDNQ